MVLRNWRTCEDAEGKLMPSSFKDLIVAPTRLSCGSFWNSSAHSTIRAFSFSHTLGWACKKECVSKNASSNVLLSWKDYTVSTLIDLPPIPAITTSIVNHRQSVFLSLSLGVSVSTVVMSHGLRWIYKLLLYLPCSAHSVLHWQTPESRFPGGRFCRSLIHKHWAAGGDERMDFRKTAISSVTVG